MSRRQSAFRPPYKLTSNRSEIQHAKDFVATAHNDGAR